MRVTGSLTKILVCDNRLGDEGATILCNALRESTVTKVQELSLSDNSISADGISAIAALCAATASLTSVRSPAYRTPLSCILQMLTLDCSSLQLDLSNNNIGGSWEPDGYDSDGNEKDKFVADLTVVEAIADAVRVSASLTSLSLADNNLGDDGVEALSVGLKESKRLATLDLSNKYTSVKIGPKGAAALASAIAAMGSTKLDVRYNGIKGDGASQLSAAVLASTTIEIFNEIPIKELRADSLTELKLSNKDIGNVGAMVVAGLVPVMASLTSVR